MSYEEFWQMDYLLVESYVVKMNEVIDRETNSNYEQAIYNRAALIEVASMIHTKDGAEKFKFPSRPIPRTAQGLAEYERHEKMTKEMENYLNELMK